MQNGLLLIRLQSRDVAMFRFLLEARSHLAYFTVLERNPALLKLCFSPDMKKQVLAALAEMAESIAFTVEPWPIPEGVIRRPTSPA